MKVQRFFNTVPVKEDVGVEIEVEGKHLFKGHLDYWHLEHDGSLRGEDNVEYVLRRPVEIKGLKIALEELNGCLKEHGSVVDMSRRTSTHVHINCTGLEMIELFNFLTLLFIFEELLVGWCGDDRDGNLFCLQSKDAEGLLVSFLAFAREKERGYLENQVRYSAINLASLNKYGTVELRSLEGTLDEERIMKWTSTLLSLREAAKTFKNPMEIIAALSEKEPKVFSKDMLGKHHRSFFKGLGRSRKILDGARRVQDIAYLVDWDMYPKDGKKKVVKKEEEPALVFPEGHEAVWGHPADVKHRDHQGKVPAPRDLRRAEIEMGFVAPAPPPVPPLRELDFEAMVRVLDGERKAEKGED